MKTIYNESFPDNPIPKGLVEIIDIHGGSYFALAVDGKVIDDVYKDSYESTVLKRSFIKKCCKISGVGEEELSFVLVHWYHFGWDKINDSYDANDFGSYKDFLTFIKTHGPVPSDYIRLKAVGISELEETI